MAIGYLDMDGVIADFMRGALARHGRLDALDDYPVGQWDVHIVLGMTADDFWKPLVGHDFWASLEPYPWCGRMFELMNDYFGEKWEICSTPCDDPYSASGKLEWLSKHLPKCNGRSFRRFHLTCKKERLANYRAILIDDSDHNAKEFCAAEGNCILFPQPWNINAHLKADPMAFVEKRLKQIFGRK